LEGTGAESAPVKKEPVLNLHLPDEVYLLLMDWPAVSALENGKNRKRN
jgi:hypothetical protein